MKDDRFFKDFVRYVKVKVDVKKYSSGYVVNIVDGIGMGIFYFIWKSFVGFWYNVFLYLIVIWLILY